jgi:flagella synthesis protein FlgN
MSDALHNALEQQVLNLENLALMLENELQHISSRNAELLMALLNDKSALLEDIQTLDEKITPLHRSAIEDGIDESTELLVSKAQTLLDECKYRTQINQKAVERGQLRLNHLRNLMMEVRAKESLTYDKSGKPKGGQLGSGVKA